MQCLHIRIAVFIYALWSGFSIFHIPLLAQSEPPNRGYSVGFGNDKQEGVEDTWVSFLRLFSNIENMLPPSRYACSNENVFGSDLAESHWSFHVTSGKTYSCPSLNIESLIYLSGMSWLLTPMLYQDLGLWLILLYQLQKPNQSVLGGFLSIRLIRILRVYKSCWRLMRSTGAKSFPAAVASSFPAADARFSAWATWWETAGVEISLSYIMHGERFFE